MNSRVFLPSTPSRFDHRTKQWLPTVDLAPAKEFGDIVVMLAPEAYRSLAPSVAAMRDQLKTFDPDNDYLLCAGHPALLAAMAGIVARKHNAMRMLVWDNRIGRYEAVEVRP